MEAGLGRTRIMAKGLKRLVLVAFFSAAGLSAHAESPFVTPVGAAGAGSLIAVPVLVSGLPFGVAFVSTE
jgi:hypothetical protein